MQTKRLKSAKNRALSLYTNLRGWRTSRKLVVFESDDWGAIRMPGRKAFDALMKAGIRVDQSSYDRLDCLESRDDLEALFGVLDAHRDATGRPARFTFNTVMGNPDFDAIERDGFERFHHQHLFDSYRRYHGQDLEPLWRLAIDDGLIRPQFHAREHLNTPLWMRDLRNGHPETRTAFDHGFYALKTRTGSPHQRNYLATYWPDSTAHLEEITQILADGLSMFERTFGYRSSTFTACNYVWPQAVERQLADEGVEMIQSQRGRIEPDPNNGGAPRVRRHFTGKGNTRGLLHGVRNVMFEPYLNPNLNWSGRALNEIGAAFRMGKPAIICTHRVNYAGGMDIARRDRNITMLGQLLAAMRHRWPNIEFISSDELARLIDPVGR